MTPRSSITRREALALAAAAVAAPSIAPASWFGPSAPSKTLRLAAIGNGRMGRGDLRECLERGLDPAVNVHVVAVCDLDQKRAADAKKLVDEAYAKAKDLRAAPKVDVYTDFKEVLARDDVDGVTISTPDFWHALIAIEALRVGKDVYLQKPLAYSHAEGKALVAAAKKSKAILQVGSQQRSDARFRQACEAVRNGRIGALRRIIVTLPEDKGRGDPTATKPPADFDYERWMGPTAEQPYAQDRVHPQKGYGRPGWLQIRRYCLGMITGWGSHMNDIAQWGHGGDRDSGLVSIEAEAEYPERGLFDVHTKFRAEGRYADGVVLVQTSGDPAGVKFEGDDGWIHVQRGKIEAEPTRILEGELPKDAVRLYASDNHYRNFLECMRTRKEPACPPDIGHRSNTICIITDIAMQLRRKLRWDPVAERFVDDDAANALLDYEHRKPWTV